MLVGAAVALLWLMVLGGCLCGKWPYGKRLGLLGVFPPAFALLSIGQFALGWHQHYLAAAVRLGQEEPLAIFQNALRISGSTLMLVAFGGVTLVAFAAACLTAAGQGNAGGGK